MLSIDHNFAMANQVRDKGENKAARLHVIDNATGAVVVAKQVKTTALSEYVAELAWVGRKYV